MFTCFKFICLLENAINNPLLKSKDYDKMKTTNSQQKIESEC